eukprot:2336537-Amphidinium_carterae.1
MAIRSAIKLASPLHSSWFHQQQKCAIGSGEKAFYKRRFAILPNSDWFLFGGFPGCRFGGVERVP